MVQRRPAFASPLPTHDLLVVSDLHLSEGRLPIEPAASGGTLPDGAGRFSRNEDFFFDEQFERFLAWYRDRPGERRWHLVINGDFLDFLQVIEVQGERGGERGLGTGPGETVRKLEQVAKGHWIFFEALAGFVNAGHAVTIVRGNHDVELHYPDVQQRLRELLVRAYQDRARRDLEYARRPTRGLVGETTVRFADWFYYEEKLLWIEHGNQYEGENSFKYWLAPLLPADRNGKPREEIDLPLGSFFVRYFFNRVEETAPFADNVKPATRFVWWLFSRHPATALRFVLRDGLLMAMRLWRASRRVGEERWAARKEEHEDALKALAGYAGIPQDTLRRIDESRAPAFLQESRWARVAHYLFPAPVIVALGLVALSVLAVLLLALPFLFGLLPDESARRLIRFLAGPAAGPLQWGRTAIVWTAAAAAAIAAVAGVAGAVRRGVGRRRRRARGERPVPGYLARSARAIVDRLDVRYVAMGHTHDADLWSIDGREREYFNTGTWTKVFAAEEERLVREDVEFVFVEGRRQGSTLKMRLMKWEDGAGEPRYLELFRERP